MILCGVMARVDITTAKIRSCICMGSGLFLEGAHSRACWVGGHCQCACALWAG